MEGVYKEKIDNFIRKILALPTKEDEKKWRIKIKTEEILRRIKMEEMNEIESDGKDIGGYLATMYSRVEKDNSVTGKIGRVRVVMFIEEQVARPYGAD